MRCLFSGIIVTCFAALALRHFLSSAAFERSEAVKRAEADASKPGAEAANVLIWGGYR